MALQLLEANAIHKTVTYKGVTKTITDTYWTSDIVPAIYPLWDSDKDKLVLFAWYDNDTYLAQKRKYMEVNWFPLSLIGVMNSADSCLFPRFSV